MLTESLMVALVEARAACEDADYDDVQGWLDAIEAELEDAPSPAIVHAEDERQKLAAWNAWAAQ